MSRRFFAMTLVELIIAIVLISIVGLGIMNIDYFSHFHVINASRRTAAQQEATIALEHMTKQISNAVGDINQPPVNIVDFPGSRVIRAWVDGNPFAATPSLPNGRRDSYPTDREIAYIFTAANGEIRYYAVCNGPLCAGLGSTVGEVISSNITAFAGTVIDNYVDISVSARWRATDPPSVDNPELTMNARIKMPAVSTH